MAGVRPAGGEAAPVQEEAHAGAHDGGELILRYLQKRGSIDFGRLPAKQLATRRRWNNWSGLTSPKLCPSSPSTSLSCPTSLSTLTPGERDGDGGVEIGISIHLTMLAS